MNIIGLLNIVSLKQYLNSFKKKSTIVEEEEILHGHGRYFGALGIFSKVFEAPWF
jgi:hypothetical protein